MTSGPAPGARGFGWIVLAHAAIVSWCFSGVFKDGRVLFFRDVYSGYAPNYEVLSRGLAAGVWPLWNAACDAGAPFLLAYPVDLALVLAGGARAPLGWGAALHLFLALVGASALAARLKMSPAASFCAGAVYGLCGYNLSLVNLLHIFQAAAWAPWVLCALVALLERPSWRATALLAVPAALQVSTLGGEIVVQTALAGLLLAPDWRFVRDRRLAHLAGAAALALLAAAPVVFGIRAVLANTARGRGFESQQALAYSLPPAALAESLVPKLLGDVHAFSAVDYWGEPFFPQGYPYLLSLYLGVSVLVLAVRAGLEWRLAAMAALGVLLSLGSHGPLGGVLAHALPMFRGPQKFVFLASLALALWSGRGLDRARSERASRAHLGLLAPGLILVAGALLLPGGGLVDLASGLFADLADPAARASAMALWPREWLGAGSLGVATAAVLQRGRAWAALAGPLVVLDLLTVNGTINPVTPASFYELRPAVREVVSAAAAQGTFRWFSYGAADVPGLRWAPEVARARRDLPLYSAERQSLRPRTHVLDGLEGAFDTDGAGIAPAGATLAPGESSPGHFPGHHARLRLGNVRWIFSFRPLPPALARLRAVVRIPEVLDPLLLFDLVDPLPRVLHVPRHEVVADRRLLEARTTVVDFDPRAVVLLPRPPRQGGREGVSPGPGRGEPWLRYAALDPHTTRVEAETPPGFLVLLEGYHPDWRVVDDRGQAVPLLEANGRYRAWWTPGGRRSFVLRYEPAWRGPAFAAALLGLAVASLLLVGGRPWARLRPPMLDTPEPAR